MNFITLKKGTLLYHGTDSRVDFKKIIGPAWLCRSLEKAKQWAGWSESGKWAGGPKRVLAYSLKRNMRLVNTTTIEQWQELFVALSDTPDPLIHQAAKAVAKADLNGWYGESEVMIVKPGKFVRFECLAWKG